MMAICGDNCNSCPRCIATESGERIELEKVKALWVRLGLRGDEFPLEKMVCHGCKPNNACAYAELRSCVQEKRVDNCGCCDDYPCRRTATLFERSDRLKLKASEVCSEEEITMLDKAFFRNGVFAPWARSWAELEVILTDGDTKEPLWIEKIARANNPMGAYWSWGVTDRSLANDMGKIAAEYIAAVLP